MRIVTSCFALARPCGGWDTRHPDHRRRAGCIPNGPNEHQSRFYRELMGAGVLIAALVALLWSGSLVVLALGALLASLVVFAGLLVIVWRRSR
jgi:hypothetical protein